jgi:hypothetical protein
MQITVNQPRPIIIGPCVLLPGPNNVTKELAAAIDARPAAKRLLKSLEAAKTVTIDKEGSADPLPRSGLQGLSAEQAQKLIDSSDSVEELESWLKGASGKVKRAIEEQIAALKAG